MLFDIKNLEGTVPLKLGYQPVDSSEPQKFYSLRDVTIKKVVTTPPAPPKTNTTATNTNEVPSNPQAKPTNTLTLKTQSIGPVQVFVPDNWIKSPHEGGDFGGFRYINPKDGNQQMLVVYSSCSGCGYTDIDYQTPDPVSLIPETTIDTFVMKDGWGAGYSYVANGNPYTGNGVVKMKSLEGYAFVEILLPDSMKSTANKILNSFVFYGVH